MTVVSSEALIRLIEVELVNQFQRFLKKYAAKSPRTCRFNAITQTPDGGYIRICKCPYVNTPSASVAQAVAQVTGKPCTTLAHAKKCPVYHHYTGADAENVPSALIEEFFTRVKDPQRRSTSFRTLHTLWLMLHEHEAINLSWITRIQLKCFAKIFKKRYTQYLIKNTPSAEIEWDRLTRNFMFVLANEQDH